MYIVYNKCNEVALIHRLFQSCVRWLNIVNRVIYALKTR